MSGVWRYSLWGSVAVMAIALCIPGCYRSAPASAAGDEASPPAVDPLADAPDGWPDFQTWAEVIKDFRTKQGIVTNIFNIADVGGTAIGIENKINSAYNTWTLKPVAALMLGDVPHIPVHTVTGSYYSMMRR